MGSPRVCVVFYILDSDTLPDKIKQGKWVEGYLYDFGPDKYELSYDLIHFYDDEEIIFTIDRNKLRELFSSDFNLECSFNIYADPSQYTITYDKTTSRWYVTWYYCTY